MEIWAPMCSSVGEDPREFIKIGSVVDEAHDRSPQATLLRQTGDRGTGGPGARGWAGVGGGGRGWGRITRSREGSGPGFSPRSA